MYGGVREFEKKAYWSGIKGSWKCNKALTINFHNFCFALMFYLKMRL